MTVTIKDGLFTFGSIETSQVPPALTVAASGDIGATNDSTQKAPLGVLYRHKGNVYRYVLMNTGASAVASAAGAVVHWFSLDPANGLFTVVTDKTDAGGTSVDGKNLIAGIALGVVTNGYYTWIQVGGVAMAYVADSTVAGDICVYGDTDLYFARIAADAAVTALPFGVALEAKSGTTTSKAYTLLHNMIF
jgi:hypothetical protein